jgi:hypothetical protein
MDSFIDSALLLFACRNFILGGRGGGELFEIETRLKLYLQTNMLYLFFPFQISEKE